MLRTSNSSSSYYKFSGLLAVALLGIATIIGSGGGGGGGGPAPDTSTPIVYSGVTTIATITPTNASKLTSDVTGGADAANIIGGGLSGVAIERNDATRDHGSGAIDIALRLSRSFRKAAAHAKRVSSAESTVSAVIPVDETEPCDSNQGTLRISGTLSDSGTGTVSVTFSSCLSDGVTVNGSATMRIDAFDLVLLVPTDLTLSFARLTFRAPDLSVDVGGSMRVETNVGLDTETITANLVFLDNSTGETGKTENLVIVKVTTSPTSYTVSISGRVYDHVHGYVDITTPITLVYSTLTQVYPDSGEILLTGDLNGSIRVTALSSTLVMLALDLDGDGTPENTVTLKWSDLTEPAGSDLGDDDGDGMHNSWEIANGLLPNFDDSADDKDGDGASNIEEYLAGTDPNDPASAPVDLSISITDSPDPATPGVSLTYSVEVSNPGSLTAFDVVVTDALPASLSLVSATASQGSCAGTTLLSCDLGSLNGSSSAFVTIIVTPSTQGVVSNTANVTSSTPDSDLSNNSATATTTVGPAEADLSISISDSVDPVAEGETYTYRLEVQNLGPSVAADVRVENALPTGVNFVSATGNEWDCNNLSGTVVCTRPSLQAGGAAAPPISLEVTALIAGGEISNTASVSSTALDPDLGNNSATETTTVVRLAASSVNLDLGADAFDMELDAARQRLYVSVPGLNEVVIVSASNWTVLNRVVVGGSPHGIDMSQDGSVLYVALNQGGAVAVVDLSTLAVSQVPVATELDTVLAYDVSAATPNAVFVSGNPGSSGLAYIVKIDTLNSNLVTRVASDRIIRADPFFVASADQQFLYVGEGFLPQSVYKLDLAQADVPLVLEDAHGSIIWAHHLDISPDGSQLFLSSGQVLSTDTLTETGRLFDFSISIGGRVTIVSNDGTKAYVGTDPNRIDVYDISTLLKIDAFATSCAITDRVNITDIQRIIELQANVSWILLGQQTVCRVDL